MSIVDTQNKITTAIHVFENSTTVDAIGCSSLPDVAAATDVASVVFSVTSWSDVLLAACYWVFITVGVIGNLLVIAVACYRNSRKQVKSKSYV
jgi:hypothetical protein